LNLMEPAPGLQITARAAAELCRFAARAGQPGRAYLELVAGSCETWALKLSAGAGVGQAMAWADGITLFGRAEQLNLLQGLMLDYQSDLSGGGFLLRGGERIRSCACGSAFTPLAGG
jgi:Fe-S cluster assembly iron-binding protein IscA